MRLLLAAAILLSTTACAMFVGDHPFSSLPKSHGHIDRYPEVFVARGQADVVCAIPGADTILDFFVYFRWMPVPAEVTAWAGAVDGKGERHHLTGAPELTFHLHASGQAGMLAYHQLNLAVGNRVYSTTTILVDCGTGKD